MKRTDIAPRPLLVLVPGLACDGTVWKPWQPLQPALHAQVDTWVPPSAVHHRISDMVDRIAGSTLLAVPHCGRMSTMEQAQAVSAALLGWLQADGTPSLE